MPVLKIIPAEHWAIMQKYMDDNNGIILVPEETLHALPEAQAQMLQEADGEPVDYEFGGEADIWVDVLRPGNYCANTVLERLGAQTAE